MTRIPPIICTGSLLLSWRCPGCGEIITAVFAGRGNRLDLDSCNSEEPDRGLAWCLKCGQTYRHNLVGVVTLKAVAP